MKIAVDIGFGYTKVKSEDGVQKSFPSVFGKAKKELFGKQFRQTKEDYRVVITIGGEEKRYYVGDLAIINSCVRNWNSDKSMDKEQLRVLALTALALVVDDNTNEVDLILGLPISLFQKYSESLKSVFEGLEAKVKLNDKADKEIIISSVSVGMQSLGAYFALVTNKDEKIEVSSMGIIDVGYRTVDYLMLKMLRNGTKKKMAFLDSHSGTLEEEGVYNVFKDVMNRLKEDDINVPILELEQTVIYNKGILDTKIGKVDVNDYMAEALDDLARRIKSQLNVAWGEMAEDLSLVYLCGGGGALIHDYLKEHYTDVRLQDEARFVNCDGYLKSM